MLNGKYLDLYNRLVQNIEKRRIFHDPLYTLAYGTDASFYRLIPKIVIIAKNEEEVSFILKNCHELTLPVTFRAAGTSLSGQAISDSVLVIAGSNWNKYTIYDNGSYINLEPGIRGGYANNILAPYGRKIGPDPASINAAMIGGIASNNASGMCCGTAQNSYKTVAGIRIILADGTVLDTKDETSRKNFTQTHSNILSEITCIASKASDNEVLANRIRKKYKMKNTTGYSLNALVDFSDPFDIIEHLMIGSEGTLGFISSICYKTVMDYPHKASALMIFPDIENACKAVTLMKSSPVAAVELIDRAGLRSVEDDKGVPDYLKLLSDDVCALLVETIATDEGELNRNIHTITEQIKNIPVEKEIIFTSVPSEYNLLWNIRKGLFPSVGAMRKTGTTVIIEDVAFPVEKLADATLDLQMILKKYRYDESVIFGHALEGNLHFVFTQNFGNRDETERYRSLMTEVADLVVKKYDGSLKAEHGTGRNMAPFVELEWGREAYELMKEIKDIFDPDNILNPGVILNPDPEAHLKNLKPLPVSSEITDKCTECGFCEPSCVAAGLTLSPRQRVVIHREITSLKKNGMQPHISALLAKSYSYAGDKTCATDGLCALACPVKIDTGKLIKHLRYENSGSSKKTAMWIASHMSFITSFGRKGLSFVSFFHSIFGDKLMYFIAKELRRISFNTIPAWNNYMPGGAAAVRWQETNDANERKRKVVYFPSCINRTMGKSKDYEHEEVQLTEKMIGLLHKAGYEVIFPDNMDNLCCGMAFLSKGYIEAGMKKSAELEDALLSSSMNGKYPVLCDMSPCLFTMKENFKSGIKLYEPVEFIMDYLLPYLSITPSDETVTVFPVCSMKKMDLDKRLADLAGICAREVIVPETNCCGFAGDRGFTYPELNGHGLSSLRSQLPDNIKNGYSTSRTCEIGLSLHSGISYKSIVYLVDTVSVPKDKS